MFQKLYKWLIAPGFIGVVSLALCLTVLVGCSFASFTAAAEEDIPVVIQMVTNITNIIAPGVSADIVLAGNTALASLQILCGSPAPGAKSCDPTSLIGQYDANASASLLSKIQAALSAVNVNISKMLALATGLPPSIGAAIVTAISVALATVTSLISIVGVGLTAQTSAVNSALKSCPRAKTVKKQWNSAVKAQWPSAAIA